MELMAAVVNGAALRALAGWRPRRQRGSLGAVLLRAEVLDGIRSGAITLAFRRWQRPSVRAGGSLLTSGGQLRIVAVDKVEPESIGDGDARRAGYPSRAALLEELGRRDSGDVYRIELGGLGPDPRVALREQPAASAEETSDVLARLRRLDERARSGPWTRQTLELIERYPATLASRLASRCGRETAPFKLDVRKLKTLGLTESLDIGYRLSPRGRALLAAWRASEP